MSAESNKDSTRNFLSVDDAIHLQKSRTGMLYIALLFVLFSFLLNSFLQIFFICMVIYIKCGLFFYSLTHEWVYRTFFIIILNTFWHCVVAWCPPLPTVSLKYFFFFHCNVECKKSYKSLLSNYTPHLTTSRSTEALHTRLRKPS